MAKKSLEQLKKERDSLVKRQNKNLRKAAAKKSLDDLSRARDLEEKRVKAEIFALKNPRSLKAKKSLKKASGKFGNFIKKRAAIMSENISEAAREQAGIKQPRNIKKKIKRRPTISRKIRRR